MIGHIGFYVNNLKESKIFYTSLLKVLDYEIIFENEACLCLGREEMPYFEIYVGKPTSPMHIAFSCDSQGIVNQFYATALELGAKSNGEPGYRNYLPNYYACFVLDPNGHNLEGVCLGKP